MDTPTLVMDPAPGAHVLRFVGDRVVVRLRRADGLPLPAGWQGRLRTTIGRVAAARAAIVARRGGSEPFAGSAWRDIRLRREDDATWIADLPLTEIGWFRAKAFAIDTDGHQHWPDGHDLGIAVHPDETRTGNTIYCAFVRQFGATRTQASTADPLCDDSLAVLDRHGYTVIPPSGTLRDVVAQLPHIVDRLGCRILHLLPVAPTPTTYARFGRYGSPYAGQDLIAIDPALVEFDRRTTGIDQFRELTYACHRRGCRVFLDVVLNHTGWGSTLQERHPEWFQRDANGNFHSPGAWGVTWEDLVELDHGAVALWDVLAEALLEWCRRGIDGFRCDAGYMVPLPAWQYITARVRQEFPDTVFLLEGLGGAWEATTALLAEGGLQWAYSELFQNRSPREVSAYLDHQLRHTGSVGALVHYSETHDNDRLAKQGREWSLLRNQLCALLSTQGAFGFTAGVEWLAREKIDVHRCSGLNWDASEHIIDELAILNRLLRDHPCWFDGATAQRHSADDAQILVVSRTSADGLDRVLILANLDPIHSARVPWNTELDHELGSPRHDLLTGAAFLPLPAELVLAGGAVHCLAAASEPVGINGDAYRRLRAQARAGYRMLSRVIAPEAMGPIAWQDLADLVGRDVPAFLAALSRLDQRLAEQDLKAALRAALGADGVPLVVQWRESDRNRVLPVPQGSWLLVHLDGPFTARLNFSDGRPSIAVQAITSRGTWWAAFPPHAEADAILSLDAFDHPGIPLASTVRFLAAGASANDRDAASGLMLLTNGRGAMLRTSADLGRITSKYDCLLAANLHAAIPVDRHVLIKRMRAWTVADGFITPLDGACLVGVSVDGSARWSFVANAGDGRTAEIHLEISLIPGRNALEINLHRPDRAPLWGDHLGADAEVAVVLRFDLEDRSFHGQTVRDDQLDAVFNRVTTHHADGFTFAPAPDRTLVVRSAAGVYRAAPEWCTAIPHPVEATRGMAGSGDAWSPGWFRLPLAAGATVTVEAGLLGEESHPDPSCVRPPPASSGDAFLDRLAESALAYLVRRDDGHSVIAGYPWFLDWGRDTLICARGLIALGHGPEILGLLRVFGRFEANGTLPNCIHGEDASNRDTSDAPLWYGIACAEAAATLGNRVVYDADAGGRRIRDVLAAIATGYLAGTPNGIQVDPASGLVWSPSHFTWMDTNHPAGTPREGYPIEIQVLWWRLLCQLTELKAPSPNRPWRELAEQVRASIDQHFWLEDRGWYADHLIAPAGTAAEAAVVDRVLRSNALFAISLGAVQGERARRMVEAARTHLVVPGALRSLAPLPAHPLHPIYDHRGTLLNDPAFPYWGRYEGDEDTRRKPAYHNGTAWVWTFPTFCEAFAIAYDRSPAALATARSYLGSTDRLLGAGCLGHLPEIIDGDAPHAQRGCDAQAWSVTETARVWLALRD